MIEGLKIIAPNDIEALKALAYKVGKVKDFWPDELRDYNGGPGQWFLEQYHSVNNIVFDFQDGAGMMAVLNVIKGWRGQVYVAKWDRRAIIPTRLWQAAAKVAMLTHDLLVLDGFIRTENKLAQRNAERQGMRKRGLIKGAVTYNGVLTDVYWYEIDRDMLGIPQE